MNCEIKSIKNKRILISPLNWGLGHVTRTVPVIQQLIDQSNQVFVACDSNQKSLYIDHFPDLDYIHLAPYPFKFGGKGQWGVDLLKSHLNLRKFMLYEKQFVKEASHELAIDLIISDQRYGFCHPEKTSIFISHQLKLAIPWYFSLAQWMNKYYINRFNHIWVPDKKGSVLSGKLSRGFEHKKSFIGYCSQLFEQSKNEKHEKKYDYLGIVSGPSPYAEKLYELLLDKLEDLDKQSAIVVPESIYNSTKIKPNITVHVQPSPTKLNSLFDLSSTVIARNGYTTLLDLEMKGNSAILIPTPKQHEQIYLSYYHTNHPKWMFVNENNFYKMTLD